ncbi:class I SAM-dependent methyltransferase [Gammaproteobacteria bacterium]|nr:class I SAM-dependent methyltransferase [Gammaproteobacteria bacterium]
MITKHNCSICEAKSLYEVIDLGSSPPANNFSDSRHDAYKSYPLKVEFCGNCKNIQLKHCLDKEDLYSNYTYSTPNARSLTDHYKKILQKINSFSIAGEDKKCLEVGSNNGNLLLFLKTHFYKVIGIDPATNIVKQAEKKGITTINDFLSAKSSQKIYREHGKFDLVIARHMFAHNASPIDLLENIDKLVKDEGIIFIENAYAISTFENGEFDQIYHEHMFYYSVLSFENILKEFEYRLVDLLFSPIHGGTVSFIASKSNNFKPSSIINETKIKEEKFFKNNKGFLDFKMNIEKNRSFVLDKIDAAIDQGKKVIAYGAPAKAFTLFSFYGLNQTKIKYCVDTLEYKAFKFFPGTGIQILPEKELQNIEYDLVLVCAWNYKDEIVKKSNELFKKNTELIFPIPAVEVIKL